ncbi:hypothetical protein ILYODFUR_035765, partial [Ilyodon furcidens]
MVYSTGTSVQTQTVQTQSRAAGSAPSTAQDLEAKDEIRFWLLPSVEKMPSSPRASLRTKQEDVSRQRASPSQGKYVQLNQDFL